MAIFEFKFKKTFRKNKTFRSELGYNKIPLAEIWLIFSHYQISILFHRIINHYIANKLILEIQKLKKLKFNIVYYMYMGQFKFNYLPSPSLQL